MKKIFAFLFYLTALNVLANTERPIVQIDTGVLQGTFEHNMQAFKGIPYAAPPVGELRWRPPQPAKPWVGTRDASKFGRGMSSALRKELKCWA